jgi:hypothetical protein
VHNLKTFLSALLQTVICRCTYLAWFDGTISRDIRWNDNQLIPWGWVLLEKPPAAQLLKNFPKFYGTWRFITMFTRAIYWSLS